MIVRAIVSKLLIKRLSVDRLQYRKPKLKLDLQSLEITSALITIAISLNVQLDNFVYGFASETTILRFFLPKRLNYTVSNVDLWKLSTLTIARNHQLVNLWRFKWRDSQFKWVCWVFCHWKRWWIEYYLLWAQFFHQNELGRDVELQNTYIILLEFPRHVMQISTHSEQLGLGSKLFDWYRDATTIPYGQFLIDYSPRTDDRLRFRTNTGTIPSKFHIPDRLEQSKFPDDKHTKSTNSSPPGVPIIFPQTQQTLHSFLPNRFHQVSLRMYSKPFQKKLAKHYKTSRDKISERSSIALPKKNLFRFNFVENRNQPHSKPTKRKHNHSFFGLVVSTPNISNS